MVNKLSKVYALGRKKSVIEQRIKREMNAVTDGQKTRKRWIEWWMVCVCVAVRLREKVFVIFFLKSNIPQVVYCVLIFCHYSSYYYHCTHCFDPIRMLDFTIAMLQNEMLWEERAELKEMKKDKIQSNRIAMWLAESDISSKIHLFNIHYNPYYSVRAHTHKQALWELLYIFVLYKHHEIALMCTRCCIHTICYLYMYCLMIPSFIPGTITTL